MSSKPSGKFVYNPNQFSRVPRFKPFDNVKSAQDFSNLMLKVVTGSDKHVDHIKFLTYKLNQVAQIFHRETNRLLLSNEEKQLKSDAELWAVDYILQCQSPYVNCTIILSFY